MDWNTLLKCTIFKWKAGFTDIPTHAHGVSQYINGRNSIWLYSLVTSPAIRKCAKQLSQTWKFQTHILPSIFHSNVSKSNESTPFADLVRHEGLQNLILTLAAKVLSTDTCWGCSIRATDSKKLNTLIKKAVHWFYIHVQFSTCKIDIKPHWFYFLKICKNIKLFLLFYD